VNRTISGDLNEKLPKDMNTHSEAALSHEAFQLINVLEDLDARIARLATAPRMPLNTNHALQAAINSNDEAASCAVERRSGLDRRPVSRAAASPECRTNSQRFELRGLLVMRFSTETKLAELIGALHSRQIICSVARSLEHQGFLPGAGGLAGESRGVSLPPFP
jgi:hypothetical protein